MLFLISCALKGDGLIDRHSEQFVDVKSAAPSIIQDIRYYGSYNFVGERIDGYISPNCLLTKKATQALKRVQEELNNQYLSLKVYDCYRPQKAVDHFVRWAEDLKDKKMKPLFYPGVKKSELFKKGYLAAKSGHSRGSTLDVTLIPLPVSKIDSASSSMPGIDMGTPFDYFGERSHTINDMISQKQQENRLFLKKVMERHGFKNLKEEWWHYTLKDEPFPDIYFNFNIE